MFISKLEIDGFRNLKNLSWAPSSGLNFISGENGQGKTSILEAIGFASNLKSFRSVKTADLLGYGLQSAAVGLELSIPSDLSTDLSTFPRHHLAVSLLASSEGRVGKKLFFNQKPVHQVSQFLMRRFGDWEIAFHCVSFDPVSHELVHGDPEVRREALDRMSWAFDRSRLEVTKNFSALLSQRNALLKQAQEGHWDSSLFESFTERWVQSSALIMQSRLRVLKDLIPIFRERAKDVAPSQRDLSFGYVSSWVSQKTAENIREFLHEKPGLETSISLEIFERDLRSSLQLREAVERSVGHTILGPQRDDWQICLDGKPIRNCGSQGEIRTSLLALKLAEIEIFRRYTGHQPVFLLDDFSSELDRKRRDYLMEYLKGAGLQVFVTTTEEAVEAAHPVLIENGCLIPQEKKIQSRI